MTFPVFPRTDPTALAAYEDRINEALSRSASPLRVCAHADRTVSLTGHGNQVAVECDYCPEVAFTTEYGPQPVLPLHYYLDRG